jgi:hypothetical protein
MSLRLTVRFASPEAADDTLIHRVRNFAEDLQRTFARDGVAQVENRDTAVTSVCVTVESQRHLGSASTLVRATPKRQNLSEGALIERQGVRVGP